MECRGEEQIFSSQLTPNPYSIDQTTRPGTACPTLLE